ncbi:MAG: serine/threonine protein kinase [Pirellulales bacterium]|nr:serine/threonine protein kinase [Pirellulales bacterium]
MSNFQLGEFDLSDVLGTGTVGSIYRAAEKKTGNIYALKLLLPMMAQEKLVVMRFERELYILERLNHPNIIRYYGRGRDGDQLFYVMELIKGATLKQVLGATKTLPWPEAVECGRQICSALQHAHNHGVIHRDLKPGNIFVSEESGELKLGDFGIARDMRSQDVTEAGLTVGTYAYMAPELIRGERFISGAVDLYALGCVMFELLTGRTPYIGDNFAQIFDQHLQSPIPSVREFAADCPRELDDLVTHLLDKEPGKRPLNARAVQSELVDIFEKHTGKKTEAVERHADDRSAESVRPDLRELPGRIRFGESRDVSWIRMLALAALVAALVGVAVYYAR